MILTELYVKGQQYCTNTSVMAQTGSASLSAWMLAFLKKRASASEPMGGHCNVFVFILNLGNFEVVTLEISSLKKM